MIPVGANIGGFLSILTFPFFVESNIRLIVKSNFMSIPMTRKKKFAGIAYICDVASNGKIFTYLLTCKTLNPYPYLA